MQDAVHAAHNTRHDKYGKQHTALRRTRTTSRSCALATANTDNCPRTQSPVRHQCSPSVFTKLARNRCPGHTKATLYKSAPRARMGRVRIPGSLADRKPGLCEGWGMKAKIAATVHEVPGCFIDVGFASVPLAESDLKPIA